jgi:putative transposase
MKFDSQIHNRRSIRLKGYDYSQPGGYYITIVPHQRENLFGEIANEEMVINKFGQIAKQQWEKLPCQFHNIELSTFIIMPNHVHGIIMINNHDRGIAEDDHRRGTAEDLKNLEEGTFRRVPTERFGKPITSSIPIIVRSYKSAVSYRINLMRGAKDIPVRQRNYYEHIICNQNDLEQIYKYIQFNPIQWAKDEENLEWQSHH